MKTLQKRHPLASEDRIEEMASEHLSEVAKIAPAMSRRRIRAEVLSIAKSNPSWTAGKITRELATRYQNEPRLPTLSTVSRWTQNEEKVVSDWVRLSPAEKKRLGLVARDVMREVISTAEPEADRGQIVEKAVEEFKARSGGVAMQKQGMSVVYADVVDKSGPRRKAAHKDREGMTTKEKRDIVFEIRDANPLWTYGEIATEFIRRFPTEPHPPSSHTISRYLRSRGLSSEEVEDSDWTHMGPQEKAKYSALAKEKIADVKKRMPNAHWTEAVSVASREFYTDHGIHIRPESMHKWYSKTH